MSTKRHILSEQEYLRAIEECANKNAKKRAKAIAEHGKALDAWHKCLVAGNWEGVRKARIRIEKAEGVMSQIDFDTHNLDAYGEPMRLQAVPLGGGAR